MADTTTMTIRVDTNLKERLDRLAHDTRRSRSYLAAEAVEAYVSRQLSIIDGISQGFDDVAAGRVTSHEDVMRDARGIVAEARRSQASRA